MEKYSITVSTQADACYMNNMIAQRGKRFVKLDFDGYPLHVGVNYTNDPFVRRCVDEYGGWAWIRIEPMSKKFNLRNEFGKFRLCVGIDVFMTDPIDTPSVYTLYFGNKELVSIGLSDGLDNDRKYIVFVNNPYYENGLHGFEIRKVKSRNQYIFLKTRSAKIAFNMVNRIVANMRYPKTKYIW